jgi:ABC-type transport system involved in Fe-S cluster assembly fused permease/ATPase subunit
VDQDAVQDDLREHQSIEVEDIAGPHISQETSSSFHQDGRIPIGYGHGASDWRASQDFLGLGNGEARLQQRSRLRLQQTDFIDMHCGPNNNHSQPPPSMSYLAMVGTVSCVIFHLVGFAQLLYASMTLKLDRQIRFFTWILGMQIVNVISWSFCASLLKVRYTRWDQTWVVAGFWALASVLGVLDVSDHISYWSSPTSLEVEYAKASGTFIFAVSLIVRVMVSISLSGGAMRQFYKRSKAARAVADQEISNALSLNHVTVHESAAVENNTSPTANTPLGGGYEAEPKFRPPSSFQEYMDKIRRLLPYLWPQNDRYLQFLMVLCFALLALGRIVNVLLPLQYKSLIDILGDRSGDKNGEGTLSFRDNIGAIPWGSISKFVFLRFLQGSVGMVSTTQDVLWIPIGQYTTRAISIRMFTHLHSLSHRFHLTRKTGEILRVQDRGVSSIVTLLSTILFNIAPTMIDILIAVAFLTTTFDIWFGIIVLLTMILYIIATIRITERRTKYRRKTNLLENAMQAKAVDSLLNFETVKFYNAEQFEAAQYARAMSAYQRADWKSSFTSAVLNVTQNIIIQLGLLAGTILCVHRVINQNVMTIGDFVLFVSFLTQLYGPLNDLGSHYKQLQKNFVDMEKMLELLSQQPEVMDPEPAENYDGNDTDIEQEPLLPLLKPPPLYRGINVSEIKGNIIFKNVSFSYDPRMQTLNRISFEVPPGKTVALVGTSGSGKSTILRLLFRFYDVQEGSITIDGIDIRHIPLHDLRSLIGVVPQDTVLFNDTLQYNIRYGRVAASDSEVENAAKAAQIHERIMTFPDRYATKCGERGMRLRYEGILFQANS